MTKNRDWILPNFVNILTLSAIQFAATYGFGPHSYSPSHSGACSQCPPGTGLLYLCNSTQDTVCQACDPEHTFSPSHYHILECVPCSLCGPDLYVDRKCTPSSDTLCDACSNKRSSYSWEYLESCRPDADPLLEKSKDELALMAEQDTNLQILREELKMRNELAALRSKVDKESLSILKLGLDLGQMVGQPGEVYSPSKKPANDSYAENPKTVLAAAVLVSFGLLGLGTVAVVWVILNWNKRRRAKNSYGGAKTGADGMTLLRVEDDDSMDEDVVV